MGEDTKLVRSVAKNRPPAAGLGRKLGSKNATPKAIKDMILEALAGVGGVEYLKSCAKNEKTTAAFLGLVGKVLPLQISGEGGGPLLIAAVEWTIKSDDPQA
jgi:hypothetical protein